jgi:hypothetical protein
MNGQDFGIVCIHVVLWAAFALGGFTAGAIVAEHNSRQAAIEAGVAYWDVNEKTGEVQFKWRGETDDSWLEAEDE